jgi:hypothetical protein
METVERVYRALCADDALELARCVEQKLIAEPNIYDICQMAAPRCLRWTLEHYPRLANSGSWSSHLPPRERKPLVFLLALCVVCQKLDEIVEILLEHGAEAYEPGQPTNPLVLLLVRWTGSSTYLAVVKKSGKLLIDYGASPPSRSVDSELYCYWLERQKALALRRDACLILFCVMRARMPKDVARFIVKSAPLAPPMSWKAWMPEQHIKKQKK